MVLPILRPGEHATCPRCGYILVRRHLRPAQRSMALAISALIALILATSFPFVSFETKGVGNNIDLTQTATSMIGFHQPLLAIVVALTIIVLPTVYLCGVIWLQLGLLRAAPFPFTRGIARSLTHLNPWMMADVFIIAVLVSLIKIAGMAQIELGISFWAFCAFAILLLMTTRSIDADWMWFSLAGEPQAPKGIRTGETAAPQGLAGCSTCGLINKLSSLHRNHCRRCGDPLHLRLPHSLQRTWALLVAAIVMYVPANIYPIMTTTVLGQSNPATIVGGAIELVHKGSWPIAAVIFFASIIVPVGKILVLIWLTIVIRKSGELSANARTKLYRVAEFIGRWSMIDLFVVAILVTLIRAGNLLSITPGPAALAFGAVVILTMLAAMTFDPRLIWDSSQPALKQTSKETINE